MGNPPTTQSTLSAAVTEDGIDALRLVKNLYKAAANAYDRVGDIYNNILAGHIAPFDIDTSRTEMLALARVTRAMYHDCNDIAVAIGHEAAEFREVCAICEEAREVWQRSMEMYHKTADDRAAVVVDLPDLPAGHEYAVAVNGKVLDYFSFGRYGQADGSGIRSDIHDAGGRYGELKVVTLPRIRVILGDMGYELPGIYFPSAHNRFGQPQRWHWASYPKLWFTCAPTGFVEPIWAGYGFGHEDELWGYHPDISSLHLKIISEFKCRQVGNPAMDDDALESFIYDARTNALKGEEAA